jgi:uncharacterized protein YhbP (UPF0306 family)
MNITDVEGTIRDYISGLFHLSLATSINDKPWVCEVHFSYDDELNLYFQSKEIRRHSQEIEHNNHVAGNIVSTHAVGDKVRGVYFEGTAKKIEFVDEKDPGYISYSVRFNTGKSLLEELNSQDGHTFYKISVANYYLFDSVESLPSQKYELAWHS